MTAPRVLRIGLVPILVALVFGAVLASPARPAPPCNVTFDGGAGTSSWHDAANWSTDTVPAAGDNVCVPAGSSVEHQTGTSQVRSIGGGGTVRLSGGELAVGEATDAILGSFELVGGTLTGSGTLSIGGSMAWSGGSMGGDGSTVVAAGARLSIDAACDYCSVQFDGSRTLRNEGEVVWSRGYVYSGPGSPVIENVGSFDARSEVGYMYVSGSGAPRFHNAGSLVKGAGSGDTQINWPLDNDGTVDATAGSLLLGVGLEGADQSGAFGLPGAVGRVRLSGGSFRLVAGASVAGVRLDGASVLVEGAVSATGPVELAGGTLAGSGTLTVEDRAGAEGSMAWSAGSMGGDGSTVVAAGARLSIDAACDYCQVFFEGSRTLRNEGEAVWSRGYVYAYSSSGYPQSALIENVGSFDARSETGYMYMAGIGAPRFHNAGSLVKGAGSGDTQINWPVDNDGTVNAAEGRLLFGGSSFPQSADGRRLVQIRGPQAGTDFGVVRASYAKLNGILEISTASSFIPALGQTFKVMEYSRRNGQFLRLQGAEIDTSRSYRVRYDDDGVVLVVEQAAAGLSLEARDAPGAAAVGEPLSYTLTARNTGPDSARPTILRDELPSGTALVRAVPTQGRCTGGGTLTCDLGRIEPGASASVDVTLKGTRPGAIDHDATVTSEVADPTRDDNAATIRGTVVAGVASRPTPAPNRAPIARSDRYSFSSGQQLRRTGKTGVLANDSDPDGDVISAAIVRRSRSARGLRLDPRTGALRWRPSARFRGTAWVRYRVRDARGSWSRVAIVRVRVGPARRAPVRGGGRVDRSVRSTPD